MSLDVGSSALPLNLIPSSGSQIRPPSLISIHPSVLAAILTHHSRRPSESTSPRVIGTLMGMRSESGQEVEIRTSFAELHDEDKVAIDMPFHQEMVDLLSKNGSKESIVGWYATSSNLNSYSALIQTYFTSETSPYPAIHLTVDTDMQADGQGLGVKGWVSIPLGSGSKPDNWVFLPVPVQIKYAESERPALDLLTTHPTPSPSLPPLPTLASSLEQLSVLIDQCLAYVKGVNAGTQKPDVEVGRYLLEGVGRWAGDESEEGGVKKGLQDTLTVSYMSSLVRMQVELSGRLALLQQGQQQPQQPQAVREA